MEKIIRFLTIWSDWSIDYSVEGGWWMNGISLIVGFIVAVIVIWFYIDNVMSGIYPKTLRWKSIGFPIVFQIFLLWVYIQIPSFYSWIIGVIVEALYGYFLNGSGTYEAYLDHAKEVAKYKNTVEEYKQTYQEYLTL